MTASVLEEYAESSRTGDAKEFLVFDNDGDEGRAVVEDVTFPSGVDDSDAMEVVSSSRDDTTVTKSTAFFLV
jgi:hypothetical protein